MCGCVQSLTATAAEQRAQLEVQDERSLDLSVLSNLVLTLGRREVAICCRDV